MIAHELSHVRHRDILISSVAATIAAAIMMVARMAQYAAIFGGMSRNDDREGANPIGLLLTIVLAPLRKRPADIVPLAEHIARSAAAGLAHGPIPPDKAWDQ